MRTRRSRKNPVVVKAPWIPISLEVTRSRAFAGLSPHATKLFFDMCSRLGGNGAGNGDIAVTDEMQRLRGWTSKTTWRAALKELIEARFVIVTRQGSKRRCSLYALTPWPLECDARKIEVGPGSYSMSDWTIVTGRPNSHAPPSAENPAIWTRPRRSKADGPSRTQNPE